MFKKTKNHPYKNAVLLQLHSNLLYTTASSETDFEDNLRAYILFASKTGISSATRMLTSLFERDQENFLDNYSQWLSANEAIVLDKTQHALLEHMIEQTITALNVRVNKDLAENFKFLMEGIINQINLMAQQPRNNTKAKNLIQRTLQGLTDAIKKNEDVLTNSADQTVSNAALQKLDQLTDLLNTTCSAYYIYLARTGDIAGMEDFHNEYYHVDVNYQNYYGETALTAACEEINCYEVLEKIIEAGTRIPSYNVSGQNTLIKIAKAYASAYKGLEGEDGAEIECSHTQENIFNEMIDVIQLLLNHNEDPYHCDNTGCTFQDYLVYYGFSEALVTLTMERLGLDEDEEESLEQKVEDDIEAEQKAETESATETATASTALAALSANSPTKPQLKRRHSEGEENEETEETPKPQEPVETNYSAGGLNTHFLAEGSYDTDEKPRATKSLRRPN